MIPNSVLRLLLASLIFVFALGSWVGINGIFCELQVLMTQLPEGDALGSAVSLAVQCSNVFLILYLVLAVVVFPGALGGREVLFVMIVFAVEALGLIMLSFMYDMTTVVGSSYHSVALLSLTVLTGGANVVSSPVFLPIMTQYPQSFSSVFAAGEGFCGFALLFLFLKKSSFKQRRPRLSLPSLPWSSLLRASRWPFTF